MLTCQGYFFAEIRSKHSSGLQQSSSSQREEATPHHKRNLQKKEKKCKKMHYGIGALLWNFSIIQDNFLTLWMGKDQRSPDPYHNEMSDQDP